MASRPDEPPESIIIGQFFGLRNDVAEERLVPGDLSIARNVDVDDAGQLRMRAGFARQDLVAYHSAREIAGFSFIVKDGVLGTVDAAGAHTPIATVGDDPLSYTAIGTDIYASSTSWSGKIASGVVSAWGIAADPGQWVSPVMTPTDTLGEVAGRQLAAPPLASIVEEHHGRIYLAVGKVLWYTELYLPNLVDKTRNFIQFEHTITMVRSVGDGLLVGTTAGLYFLQGTATVGLRRTTVMDAGVIKGSDVMVPTNAVHPQARQAPMPEGDSPVFMTERGVCVGLDNGTTFNLTHDRVVFPALTEGAALYRKGSGDSRYIYADAGGSGWAINTRTGAVTEYGNYTFNSFVRAGAAYFGATAAGLYLLAGDNDDGVDTDVHVRGGYMRFGGARLSRLKACYVMARSAGTLRLTIETGNGASYVYALTTRSMITTKVHMGKGQRATYFIYELEGAALDLDTLEFLPLVVSRRV